MKDEFDVNVEDLKDGSAAIVRISCDYCGREVALQWQTYVLHKKGLIKKDCCNNPECTGKKAQETMLAKYGVTCCLFVPEFKRKQEETNLKRYGHINPFANENVKEKKNTRIDIKSTLNKEKCKNLTSRLPKRETTNLTSFKQTIKNLTSNLTPSEKAYILFLWIGQNIDYDIEGLISIHKSLEEYFNITSRYE